MDSEEPQEIEVKFYIKNLERMEARLLDLRARLIQPRVLETNIRFDTPARDLSREKQVLRLRRDDQIHLTYKGPGKNESGVLSRTEIEFTADDFDRARQFLEALGFEKSFFYEKYRMTYELYGLHIMLDETPIGAFVEIEGANGAQIRTVAEMLGLDWSTAVGTSYAALFERVRAVQGLGIQDLSFEAFDGREVSAQDLGVRAADE